MRALLFWWVSSGQARVTWQTLAPAVAGFAATLEVLPPAVQQDGEGRDLAGRFARQCLDTQQPADHLGGQVGFEGQATLHRARGWLWR